MRVHGLVFGVVWGLGSVLFRVLGSGSRVQSCLGFGAQLVPHQPPKNLLGVSRAWRNGKENGNYYFSGVDKTYKCCSGNARLEKNMITSI